MHRWLLALALTSLTVAAGAEDLWVRRLVTVENLLPQPQQSLVSVPLSDLRLPPGLRVECLRVVDPVRQQRVTFEVDPETRVLQWLADLPAHGRQRLEVYASADADLQPVARGAWPVGVTTAGDRKAGNRSYDLGGAGAPLRLIVQDHVPYDPDVTQTHPQPLTETDQQWLRELWRRRLGVSSFSLDGQELVASYWPGFWTALSYYYDGRPHLLARWDEVRVQRGALTSRLIATGACENFAYGWGRGLDARLEMRLLPGGRLWVQWTLTARHDLAVVPETKQPAQPAGGVSIKALHFPPEFIRPVFTRALWHNEAGDLQRADLSQTADQALLLAKPGGPGWCALYDTASGRLLGLIPETWGDGGVVQLATADDQGYARNTLQMRLVGRPATNWRAGESHTWSYWLIGARAATEEQAVRLMGRAGADAGGRWRVTVGTP